MTTPLHPAAVVTAAELATDATNRAWRTLLQGLAIDVAVAVAVTVYAIATSPDPLVWNLIWVSLCRSVAQAAASYVMRRFLDPSGVPTPLPPAPVPPPNEEVPAADVVDGHRVEPHDPDGYDPKHLRR